MPTPQRFSVSDQAAQRLYMGGRYAELRENAERRLAQRGSLDPAEQSYLCGAYWKLQQYDKLFACAKEMERHVNEGHVRRSGMFEWDTVYSFMWGMALGYVELGEYDQAIEQARHSYEFGRAHQLDPFHQVYSLSALALAYALRGDRVNALRYAELLDHVDTSDYKYQSLVFEKWVNVAQVYMALGEYERALAVMQRQDPTSASHKLVRNLFLGKDALHYQKLLSELMRAKSLLETGHGEQAKPLYDAILHDPELAANRDISWIALFDRGRIAEQERHLEEAAGFYEQAIQIIEDTRATFKTEATKIGYVGDKEVVYERLVAALVGDQRYDRALEYVERSKSRALVDLLAGRQGSAVPALQEPTLRERPRDSLDSALTPPSSASPQFASLVAITRVSVPELQRLLPADETLVEYYTSGERLYAFVLTPSTLQAVELEFGGLPHRVQEFRAAIEEPGSERYQRLAQQLHSQLIGPIAPLIPTRKLTIVPHGMLHYLPFAALYDGSEYLVDRYSLRYLPSASLMQYLRPASSRPGSAALVIGNPQLPDRKPLAHAEQEAAAVAQALPGAVVLLGGEATETAFKRRAGQASYLHLATHGTFASENPLRSGLWLAKDAESDGLLSVAELYSLRLDADLVTLSACETGLGKIGNGDDLVGLTRGFLYAGSRAILASLWSVDDEATAELMRAFYATLERSGPREALRQAQLRTRQQHPHPFYWAAFQLTGQS